MLPELLYAPTQKRTVQSSALVELDGTIPTPWKSFFLWQSHNAVENLVAAVSSVSRTVALCGRTAQLLEAESSSKEIPTSAAPLWLPADPSCEQDVTRVLRRLFASSSDIASVEEDHQGDESSSPRADSGRVGVDDRRESGGGNTVAGISGARSGYYLPPPAAKVAFPALIARYCCKSGKGWGAKGLGWLDSDETTCTALELDVHALAMLVFVEWREFVSALPGCGAVLARETSALWFAQVMTGLAVSVLVIPNVFFLLGGSFFRWGCDDTCSRGMLPSGFRL